MAPELLYSLLRKRRQWRQVRPVMGRYTGNPKGFTALDAVITLCLIGVLFGIVVPRYQRLAQEAQETALKAELVNIRTSIRLFKMLNSRNPQSLKELMEKDRLRLDKVKAQRQEAKQVVADLEYEKNALGGHMEKYIGAKEQLDKIRLRVEEINQAIRKLEINAATSKQKEEQFIAEIKRIEGELEKLKEYEAKTKHLSQVQNWLEGFFLKPLTTKWLL